MSPKLMWAGRGVLVDLAERSALRDVITKWADRVEVISARCYERPANLHSILIRPDGYVAWYSDLATETPNLRERCVSLWRNGSAPPDSFEVTVLVGIAGS